MTKFLEINLDGELQIININNISYIKQVDTNTTEFALFTKDETNIPVKFLIHYNYKNFKSILEENRNIAFDFQLLANKIN